MLVIFTTCPQWDVQNSLQCLENIILHETNVFNIYTYPFQYNQLHVPGSYLAGEEYIAFYGTRRFVLLWEWRVLSSECSILEVCWCFGGTWKSKPRKQQATCLDSTFLQNVGKRLPHYTVEHPRRSSLILLPTRARHWTLFCLELVFVISYSASRIKTRDL
jgi:hypothetical protein